MSVNSFGYIYFGGELIKNYYKIILSLTILSFMSVGWGQVFYDNFDDGILSDAWSLEGNFEVDFSEGANNTSYSLHLSGDSGDDGISNDEGLIAYFDESQPTYVSFYIKPKIDRGYSESYFIIRPNQDNLPSQDKIIWFYASEDCGYITFNLKQPNLYCYQYEITQDWYFHEFKNIDFESQTFDWYVNGEIVNSAIPFIDEAQHISYIQLYNYNDNPGGETWYDEIYIGDEPSDDGCTDPYACNYDETAAVDDGSCAYEVDCEGVWCGDAVVDECGVCGGDGSSCYVTLLVPSQYPTIQSAIDAASPGDEVLVDDGLYPENLLIEKDLFLRSENGADVTTIDGISPDADEYGSTIMIRPESNTTHHPIVKIDGFRIKNGKGTDIINKTITLGDGTHPTEKVGGGLFVYVNSPKVNNCEFLDNGYNNTDKGGAIFAASSGSDIDIHERDYEDHDDLTPATGILDFSNNTFLFNDADYGHSVYILGDDYELTDLSEGYFDVYDCDNEQVSTFWVNSLESTVDATDGDGFHCIDFDQTNYYVSVYGNDDFDGTENAPFLTIEQAFSLINPNEFSPVIIHLSEGTFASSTTGEDFPIIMFSNIDLRGQSEEGTILNAESSVENQSRVIIMESCENNMISELTITGGGVDYSDLYSQNGGGMYLDNSHPELLNVTMFENYAINGGGMSMKESNPTLTYVTITSNEVANRGGGMALWSSSIPTLMHVTISGNSAISGAGGLYVFTDNYGAAILPTFTNVTISGNSTESGAGGIYLNWSNVNLTHVTITGNTSETGTGGMDIANNTANSVTNSIIWGNYPNNINYWGLWLDITYSDIDSGEFEGDGNINADPQFTDSDNGDFTLQSFSPCIDAGTADIDGDGYDDITDFYGQAPDMGAYEFDGSSPPNNWTVVNSYSLPEGASGLAYDGNYIYFGIYGVNGNNIYRLDPQNGIYELFFNSNVLEDGFGLTYDGQYVWAIKQIGFSEPARAIQLDSNGNQINEIILPDHYMSGIAFDDNDFWVATYFPNPGTIYKINQNGEVISQISTPDEQPWDISMGDASLWVADYWSNVIYEIDKNDGTTLNSYTSVGVNPSGVVWDGNYLWYCDNGPNDEMDLLYQVDIFSFGTPEINLSTSSINFGNVEINSTAEYILNVSNLGEVALILESYSITNNNFSLNSNFPMTLFSEDNIDITINFTPDVIGGDYSGMLNFFSNDPITSVSSVNLSGYGLGNEQDIQPEYLELDLGDVRIHALTSRSLNIYNQGDSELTIESVDFNLDNFYLDDSIVLPFTVLPLDNVGIRYWFSADTYGIHSAEMQIVSNDADESLISVNLEAVVVDFDPEIGSEFWSFQSAIDTTIEVYDTSIRAILPFTDLNGDNIEEILVADDNYNLNCLNGNSSGTADIIWHLDLDIPSIGTGNVGGERILTIMDDINLDGIQDIALGTFSDSEGGIVFAVSGINGSIIWYYETDEYGGGGDIYDVDAEFDYNNDSFRDVLAASGDNRVQLFNGVNGTKLWEHEFSTRVKAVISLEDITGDFIPDVVCTTDLGGLGGGPPASIYVLDGSTGNIINQFASIGFFVVGLCTINDINNDGLMDYAFGSMGEVNIVTSPADVIASFDTGVGSWNFNLESVMAYNQKSYILTTTVSEYFPLINATDGTISWDVTLNGLIADASAIEDINGDLFFDVLIGSEDEKLSVLSGVDGQEIFSKEMYYPVLQTSSVMDLDGNSTPEILVGLANGTLFCYSGGDTNGDDYLEGDINLDGQVNILDIIFVANIILGDYEANELELMLSDVNLDGNINVLDIIAIVNIILNT